MIGHQGIEFKYNGFWVEHLKICVRKFDEFSRKVQWWIFSLFLKQVWEAADEGYRN